MTLIKKIIDKKHDERVKKLKELRAEALNSLDNSNTLPYNNAIPLKGCENLKRMGKIKRLLVCIYKYADESDIAYTTGLSWSEVDENNQVHPLILWDKYGRFISSKNLTGTYSIYCMLPHFKDIPNSLGIRYFDALKTAINLGSLHPLDKGFINPRDISLKKHDSDLKLVVGKDTTNNELPVYGFKTEESEFKDHIITSAGALKPLKDVKDIYYIDKNALIELFDENKIEDLCDTLPKHTKSVFKYVRELINSININNANLLQLLLLLDCKIKVDITAIGDTEDHNITENDIRDYLKITKLNNSDNYVGVGELNLLSMTLKLKDSKYTASVLQEGTQDVDINLLDKVIKNSKCIIGYKM